MLGTLTMRTARWILLVPAAIASWWCVFAVGLFVHPYFERSMCPPADFVSGFCANDSVQDWLEVLVKFFVAVSAVFVGLTTVVIAPNHKWRVLLAALGFGLVAAACVAAASDAWSLFPSAVAGGILGSIAIAVFLRATEPNYSSKPTANAAA